MSNRYLILLFILPLLSSCIQFSKNKRKPASVGTEEGILFKGFTNYLDIKSTQHSFTMKNTRSETINYKLQTSTGLNINNKGTTCKVTADEYSALATNSSCIINITKPDNPPINKSLELSILLDDGTTIPKFLSYKDYDDDFCNSFCRLVHKNFSTSKKNSLESYMYYTKMVNGRPKHTLSDAFITDCKNIKKSYSESFDSKHVYQFCANKMKNQKPKIANQLSDFDITVTCEDAIEGDFY